MISIVVALMPRFLGFLLLYVMFFFSYLCIFSPFFLHFILLVIFLTVVKKFVIIIKIIINLATDYKQKKMLSAPTKRAVIL